MFWQALAGFVGCGSAAPGSAQVRGGLCQGLRVLQVGGAWGVWPGAAGHVWGLKPVAATTSRLPAPSLHPACRQGRYPACGQGKHSANRQGKHPACGMRACRRASHLCTEPLSLSITHTHIHAHTHSLTHSRCPELQDKRRVDLIGCRLLEAPHEGAALMRVGVGGGGGGTEVVVALVRGPSDLELAVLLGRNRSGDWSGRWSQRPRIAFGKKLRTLPASWMLWRR